VWIGLYSALTTFCARVLFFTLLSVRAARLVGLRVGKPSNPFQSIIIRHWRDQASILSISALRSYGTYMYFTYRDLSCRFLFILFHNTSTLMFYRSNDSETSNSSARNRNTHWFLFIYLFFVVPYGSSPVQWLDNVTLPKTSGVLILRGIIIIFELST